MILSGILRFKVPIFKEGGAERRELHIYSKVGNQVKCATFREIEEDIIFTLKERVNPDDCEH